METRSVPDPSEEAISIKVCLKNCLSKYNNILWKKNI